MSTVMSNVIIDCVLFNEEWLTVINTQNRVMSIILLAKTYSTCICNKKKSMIPIGFNSIILYKRSILYMLFNFNTK